MGNRLSPILWGCLLLVLTLCSLSQEIPLLTLDGPVEPVRGAYLVRELTHPGIAPLFVIQMDTPGGWVATERQIEQAILDCPVPVVIWVAPEGARAASAGAFLCLAADKVYMAPGTNIGAAHPVFPGTGKQNQEQNKDEKGQGRNIPMLKAKNDLAAHARSLAERQGRDPKIAELMVTEAKSMSAEEALSAGFCDAIVPGEKALLEALKNLEIKRPNGTLLTPVITAPHLSAHDLTNREKILSFLVDPNVAYLFLMLGLFGNRLGI